MKVNLVKEFKTLDGKSIPSDPKNPESSKMNLKDICITALLTPGENDEMSGEEKARRYNLSQDIYNAKEVIDLKVEDVTLLKKLIGHIYLPLIVGQAFKFLEGEA